MTTLSPFESAPSDLRTAFRELVTNVYTLKDPQQINICQAQLYEQQRGSYAYALAADVFRDSEDPRVKFFAALTIAIKLNHDPSLDSHQLELLLQELLAWLSQAVDTGLSAFVVRRICKTLVTVYLVPHMRASRITLAVCSYLAKKHDLRFDAGEELQDLVKHLSDKRLKALLDFAVILAEELREIEHNVQMDSIHRRASANIKDVISILNICYERNLAGEKLTSTVTLSSCHLQWLKYSKSSVVDSADHTSLSNLLSPAMSFLKFAIDDLDEFEALCCLLEKALKDPNVRMTDELLEEVDELMQGSTGSLHLDQIADGEVSDECTYFAIMALAYCRRRIQAAFKPILDHETDDAGPVIQSTEAFRASLAAQRERTMGLAQQVTTSLVSFELVETLAYAVISFWEDFVQDTRGFEPREEVFNHTSKTLKTMCLACRSPKEDCLLDADAAEELRVRTRDFVQVLCEEFGMQVIEQLAGILEMLWSQPTAMVDENDEWRELEPVLYLLTELGEPVQYATEYVDTETNTDGMKILPNDPILSSIFEAKWCSTLFDPDCQMPYNVRIKGPKLIKEFQQYFNGRPDLLWRAINMLVPQLQDARLAPAAADAIEGLCSENRTLMAERSKHQSLITLTREYFEYDSARPKAKSSLVAAAASVLEALADEAAKHAALEDLFHIISQNHESNVAAAGTNREVQTHAAEQTLDLLYATGNAFQSLQEDQFSDRTQARDTREKYWQQGPGNLTQQNIVQAIHVAVGTGDAFNRHMDKACRVLQVGLKEQLGGPFVFDGGTCATFITSAPFDHPQLEAVIKMAGQVLRHKGCTYINHGHDWHDGLHVYLLNAMGYMQHPRTDPVLASAIMTALTSQDLMVGGDLLHLSIVTPAFLQLLLSFTIESLSIPEPLPKRAATDFWLTHVRWHNSPIAHASRKEFGVLIEAAGLPIMIALLNNFAGLGSRGDLQHLSELLRELVKVGAPAKAWLEAALANPNFPSQHVGDAEKRQFAQSVIMLRGAVKTRDVVRNFWIACRGAPTGYG